VGLFSKWASIRMTPFTVNATSEHCLCHDAFYHDLDIQLERHEKA
jgi:hypothetical protein